MRQGHIGRRVTALNRQVIQLFHQGRYDRALPIARQAVTLASEAFGEDSPEYADVLNNLAALYQQLRTFSEAEPLFLQALEICRRVHGEYHPDVSEGLNNLAA